MDHLKDVFTQAGIVIALIAMLGLLLQRKGTGEVIIGTFKTLLGFNVLAAGSGILVQTLIIFGKMFEAAFNMTGIVPSIPRQ